jgi:hypothetical protein
MDREALWIFRDFLVAADLPAKIHFPLFKIHLHPVKWFAPRPEL